MSKIIGVIGGMGPLATLDLVEKIICLTPAKSDQEHLRILVDIDPEIPDRTQALTSGLRQPVAGRLLKRARGLIVQGAQLLALACNSAHAFLPDFADQLEVPIVDMIQVTVRMLEQSGAARVGLMATRGTLESGIWNGPLLKAGIEVVLPDLPRTRQVMEAIYALKSGDKERGTRLASAVYDILEGQSDLVVAGCTELPLMLRGKGSLVDPTLMLAGELVRLATG